MYVPVSYWLIALLGVVGATYFLITHDNIAAHIAVNAVVIIGVVSLVYVLNSITPPYCFQVVGYQQHSYSI